MKEQIAIVKKLAADLRKQENQTVHLANAAAQLDHCALSLETHVKKTAEVAPAKPEKSPVETRQS